MAAVIEFLLEPLEYEFFWHGLLATLMVGASCGLIGALVGLFVGKPLWTLLRDKNTTNIIEILKAAFGLGVG